MIRPNPLQRSTPFALALVLVGAACGGGGAAPDEGEDEGDVGGEGEGEGEGEGGAGGEGEGEGEGEGAASCGAPVVLDCGSGTLALDTANGAAAIGAYACGGVAVDGFAYGDRELLFSFSNPRAARVSITAATTSGTSATYQLFDLGEGGDPCAAARGCVDVRDGFGGALDFDVAPGDVRWLSYDKRDNGLDGETTALSLTVACAEFVCGNGVVDPGEGCDDNDADGGDGCSAACAVEDGFACAGTPSTCAATVCGDGVVAGDEGCDDGDSMSGDGCSAACTVEDGYVCTGTRSTCLPGSGESCAEALPLGHDATTTFDTTGHVDDVASYAGTCGFFSAEGPDLYYAVDVDAGQLLTATLSNDFDGSLVAIVDGCDDVAASCVVGTGGQAHFANHGASPQTVYVAVDGLLGDTNFAGQPRTPDQGTFTLTTATRALASAQGGEVCETAVVLTPGTPVNGTTVGRPGTANGFGGATCNGFGNGINGSGRDAFYRVTIPAQRTLRATVDGVVGNGDVAVGVVSDCTATRTACLAAQDGPSGTAAETVRFTNTANTPRDVFVVVDSLSSNDGFTFTLTAFLE